MKNNRAARAARFLVQCFDVVKCQLIMRLFREGTENWLLRAHLGSLISMGEKTKQMFQVHVRSVKMPNPRAGRADTHTHIVSERYLKQKPVQACFLATA